MKTNLTRAKQNLARILMTTENIQIKIKKLEKLLDLVSFS